MPLTKVKSGGVSDSITLTSPDINAPDIDGGTIDNAVIGGSTAAAGSFTTITATGGSSSNWNTAYGWGDHSTQSYATQTYVGTEVSNLVDSSPAALDTLNELAAALGDDPNFATTVTNSIALKAPLASPSFTGDVGIAANNSGQGAVLTLENTDTSITTNDVVGQIDFYANDGSTGGTGQKATIQAIAQNGSGTSVGLIFGTSSFPNTTATERFRIASDGAATFNSTVNGMTIKASASGDRFGCIPEIASNGVMEIGRYLDFHATDGDTSDYGARLDFDGTSLITAANTVTTGSASFNSSVYVGQTLYVPSQIIHTDDTSNYMQFHQADGWRVVNSTGERFHIEGASVVFNHDGHDADFRVESGGNANMLHVDGGNNSVGIGTTGGTTGSLVVQSNSGAGGISVIGRSNGGIGGISFYDDNGSTSVGYIQGRADDAQMRFWGTQSGGNVSFAQNNTERLRITSYGGTHARNGHLGSSYTYADNPDRAFWTLSTFNDNAHVTSGSVGIYTSNVEWQPNLIKVTAVSVDNDLTDTGSAVWYVRVNSYHGAGGSIAVVDSWTSGNMSISVTATDINQHHMRVNITVTGSGNRTVCAAESLSYGQVFETARTG